MPPVPRTMGMVLVSAMFCANPLSSDKKRSSFVSQSFCNWAHWSQCGGTLRGGVDEGCKRSTFPFFPIFFLFNICMYIEKSLSSVSGKACSSFQWLWMKPWEFDIGGSLGAIARSTAHSWEGHGFNW